MIIEQGLFFQYAFFINLEEDDDADSRKLSDIFDWCSENISGQWMAISNSATYSRTMTGLTYHSKATHASPIHGHEYPPATIHLTPEKIFAFEHEEDATAFKLQWM